MGVPGHQFLALGAYVAVSLWRAPSANETSQALLFVDVHPSDLMDGDLYSPEPPLAMLNGRPFTGVTTSESVEQAARPGVSCRAVYGHARAVLDGTPDDPRFKYLKYALALVLVFIGSKIFLVNITGKMPAAVSLGVTAALIAGGVLLASRREGDH